jgi:NAD(P)-dependent dehydrogenase (short-subunit alcohol dehydrogenase family)
MFDLTGKGALVIGGGGGIGGAIAHAMADFGARIAIADLSLDAARTISTSCQRDESGISVCRAIDVTNPDHVNQVVAEVEAELGQIDILVNSAGINIRKDVIDYTPEEWFKIINTNLSGVFFVTQSVARGMLERGYGRVISIGSVSSLMGHPQHAPYAATKGGVAIMTKAMATEWATRGVTVNAIGPAYTVTGLITELMNNPVKYREIIDTIPMGRMGKPEDIVGAAVYLASDAASFVTGQTLYVDGGRTAD